MKNVKGTAIVLFSVLLVLALGMAMAELNQTANATMNQTTNATMNQTANVTNNATNTFKNVKGIPPTPNDR